MQRHLLFGVLLLLLFSSLVAVAQRGAITRPTTLEQMTSESEVIVHGYILSSRVEPHPDLPSLSTVVVEIRIADVLKGTAPQRFSFRQFIWDIRDRMDAGGYRKGQELVLLLGPTSQIGLRSPVSLEQGRFRVQRQKDGTTRAVNGTGNISLFQERAPALGAPTAKKSNVQVSAQLRADPASLSLDDLMQLIRAYVGGR